jgi:hypothetical protein
VAVRVPNSGPAERERQRLISRFERDLRGLELMPARWREAELADIREEICRAVLLDLRAGLPLVPARGAASDVADEILELERTRG